MSAIVQQLMSYGGAADSDFVKIAEVVTTGSQSTIAFNSIPGTYRNLELSFQGAGSAATANVDLRCQFNGDTGNNYDYSQWNQLTQNTLRGIGYMFVGDMAGSTGPANMGLGIEMWILNYKGTTFQKTLSSVTGDKVATAVDGNIVGENNVAAYWRSTSAITSILLFPAVGNFVDGSVAVLYGKV